jgi:hypothetical protein
MKKILIVAAICIGLLLPIYWQFSNNIARADPRGNSFSGSKACIKCHSNLYNSYLHTAHFAASVPATEKTVHGSFAAGSNEFDINADQKVIMEKTDSGLFQAYYVHGKFKERHRFDIVFGGVKGETYLYWKNNQLYQLPLSYFSAQHKWSTSPGIGANFLDYNRARSIGKQCLECHASYIDNLPGSADALNRGEQFDKTSLVYSVDCERCHGPGVQHVDFQTNNPTVKEARFITKYSSLNRSQKLDMCAVCHSGMPGFTLRSSFQFVPGDTLSNYKMQQFTRSGDTTRPDVHGNQLQLLQSSKCFISSKMDCATCHDTHQNSRGNDALYTLKCMECHNTANHTYCKMTDKLTAEALKTNCISCHMPALPTKIISVQVAGKQSPIQFFVHTHHIGIYPQEVKKILTYISK